MRTLCILAAGPLQVPAITEARNLGIRTIAIDGNPTAPGLSLADSSYVANILDPVVILEIARHEPKRVVMVDARPPVEVVHREIVRVVRERLMADRAEGNRHAAF